jgi:hypothetical protein
MRWAFRIGHEHITAVRAVDTATHPRAQGRGLFRALTLQGVEDLTAAGVDWVFNTPNQQSAPGYLSMGWQRLGKLPMAIRPVLKGVPRLVFARHPANLWSVATSAGDDARSVLEDEAGVEELVAATFPGADSLCTDRTADFLRWRYGGGPVAYRALLSGATIRGGVVFFRLRRRGPATEAVIADVLIPGGDGRVEGRLCRQALQSSAADYGVGIGCVRPPRWIPVPAGGPLLTWRALARTEPPALGAWNLSTGDIELF